MEYDKIAEFVKNMDTETIIKDFYMLDDLSEDIFALMPDLIVIKHVLSKYKDRDTSNY